MIEGRGKERDGEKVGRALMELKESGYRLFPSLTASVLSLVYAPKETTNLKKQQD